MLIWLTYQFGAKEGFGVIQRPSGETRSSDTTGISRFVGDGRPLARTFGKSTESWMLSETVDSRLKTSGRVAPSCVLIASLKERYQISWPSLVNARSNGFGARVAGQRSVARSLIFPDPASIRETSRSSIGRNVSFQPAGWVVEGAGVIE